MINLKSFEDFVEEHISTLNVQKRLNEWSEREENLYGNISKIRGKTCLIINDWLLAMELEDQKNKVYCIYYKEDPKYTDSLGDNYQYVKVDTVQDLKTAKEQIADIFDNKWKLGRDFRFDYIINISKKTESRPGLQYKEIAGLNAFICCYPFIDVDGNKTKKNDVEGKTIIFRKGYTCYYTFDENHIFNEFNNIAYKTRLMNLAFVKKISGPEWKELNNGDNTTRYLMTMFEQPKNDEKDESEVINNRNKEALTGEENKVVDYTEKINYADDAEEEKKVLDLGDSEYEAEDFEEDEDLDEDEKDFTANTETENAETNPFMGMSEPKIYSFRSPRVNEIVGGENIKVGDTNRTVSKRLSEWAEKFPDLVRLQSWEAVLSGCGEGIDGKMFRDYTVHKILLSEVNKEHLNQDTPLPEIEHVEIPEFFNSPLFTEEDKKEHRYSNEFFRNCTPKDVDRAIEILKENCRKKRSQFLLEIKDNKEKEKNVILPLDDKVRTPGGYVDRKIQADTIKNFENAVKKGKKRLLMYAVMRFGKTYVSCRCAQVMPDGRNKFIVIVTAKPGVRNEWTETVNLHKEFKGYDMYDTVTNSPGNIQEMLQKWSEGTTDKFGNKKEPTLANYFADPANKDRHIMLFMSLHDLFGDTKGKKKNPEDITEEVTAETIKDKHKCFSKYPVDLLIIDEAHYGTQTGNFGFVIDETKNPQLNEAMKSLNLKNAVKLYLSGTPYDILMDNKFKDDEIISKYGFADIIKAKTDWDDKYREFIETHQKVNIPEGDQHNGEELHWEDNPYFGTPQMMEFGYNLQDFNLSKDFTLSDYDDTYVTKFDDLFSCHEEGGEYIFDNEEDVKQIFEILDGSKKAEGVVSFLDVPEVKRGNMCKHIVVVLPSITSCDALEKLLNDNRDDFSNFDEYSVIKATSEKDKSIDTNEVKKLILSMAKAGNKTITLTCDRLLTGVTIKPWDTMFFMKECSSPQEYDQAKFRIMNPYVKKVGTVDVDETGMPIYKGVTKINMKPQVLFVDFHPDRVVTMKARRYQSEIVTEGKQDCGAKEMKSRIEKERGSITLLLLKNGKFVSGTSADVGKLVMNAREKMTSTLSFDEALDSVDTLSDISVDEMKYLLAHGIKQTSSNNSSSKMKVKVHGDFESGALDGLLGGNGKSKTDGKSTSSSGEGKKDDYSQKDVERIIKTYMEKRKTLVKDIMMYILLMNRGNRATGENPTINTFDDLRRSFNHYSHFNRPDVKNAKIEDIPDQMIENDKIICSIFCGDLDIPNPNYDDPYDVSETVWEVWKVIRGWWRIMVANNKNDGSAILLALSNVQLKYKKLSRENSDEFKNLRGVLSKYTRLGETEAVTPEDICPKLFENVVIFNKKDKPKVLDLYCGKIGEVFYQLLNDKRFKNLSLKDKVDSYYLVCRTRVIAELNFFVIKKYLTKAGYGTTHETKREWFNKHILIFNTKKMNFDDDEFMMINSMPKKVEKLETFKEYMQKLNEEKTKPVKTKAIDKFNNAIKDKFGINMWDLVIGNPPYNRDNVQLYPIFYIWGREHCHQMSMIFPSAWQEPKTSNGLGLMNKPEIKHDKQIVYIDNIVDGFKGVSGAKNTNIIYWKKGYNNGLEGKQLVYTDGKNPQEIKFVVSTKELEKIKEIEDFAKLIKDSDGFTSIKSDIRLKAYGIRTYFSDDEKSLPNMNNEKIDDGIAVYGMINKSTRVKKYVNNDYPFPKISKALNKYKIFIPSVWGNLSKDFIGGSYSNICIAKPKDVCTESYVESGNFDNFNDAKKHAKYFMSKFLRALLVIDKTSIINSLKCYNYIPVQDYSEDFWNSDKIDDIDEGLFDKYNVPEELRKFVRENIQPKTTADILGYDGKEIDFSKVKAEDIEEVEESPSSSESLPKSIYDLDPRRLDPNPEIPEDEKYKEEDLKDAYPDQYEDYEENGGDDSFRYWLYKKVKR